MSSLVVNYFKNECILTPWKSQRRRRCRQPASDPRATPFVSMSVDYAMTKDSRLPNCPRGLAVWVAKYH